MRREILIEKYTPPTRINVSGEKFWENKRGELHSFNDQPAFISYFLSSGEMQYVGWYRNGEHRIDKNKPYFVQFYEDGTTRQEWFEEEKKIKYRMFSRSGEVIDEKIFGELFEQKK